MSRGERKESIPGEARRESGRALSESNRITSTSNLRVSSLHSQASRQPCVRLTLRLTLRLASIPQHRVSSPRVRSMHV